VAHSGTQTGTLHVTGQLCDTQHWGIVSPQFCTVIFTVQIGAYALYDIKFMFFHDVFFKFLYMFTYSSPLSIYGSPALCWALAAFQFPNLYTVGRTPWTCDQPVARPLPTHRTALTQNKLTQTSMPLVGFEPTFQCSSKRRRFVPQTARPL
jgi:hypothetical protein